MRHLSIILLAFLLGLPAFAASYSPPPGAPTTGHYYVDTSNTLLPNQVLLNSGNPLPAGAGGTGLTGVLYGDVLVTNNANALVAVPRPGNKSNMVLIEDNGGAVPFNYYPAPTGSELGSDSNAFTIYQGAKFLHYVGTNATATVTVQLPGLSAPLLGDVLALEKALAIIRYNSGGFDVVVNTAPGDTFSDGSTSITLAAEGDGIFIQGSERSDFPVWSVLSYVNTRAANSQPIIFGHQGTVASAATRYLYPGSGVSVAAEVQVRIPRAMTLKSVSIHSTAPPGGILTDVFTVNKNGVATALTVSLTGADIDETTTTNVSFAAGDLLSVKLVSDTLSLDTDPMVTIEAY